MLDTLEQCQARIEELEELLGGSAPEIVAIRRALKIRRPIIAEIIGFMLKRQYCSRVAIFTYLYGDRPECDQPTDIKIIDVQMVAVRDALEAIGIAVRHDGWGSGSWWLLNADRARIRAMMKAADEAPAPDQVKQRSARRLAFLEGK